MVKRNSIASNLLYSKDIINIDCCETKIKDILNFGLSYIEHQDLIVEYIVANNNIMKRIFGEIQESVLCVEDQFIGTLWTAKLLLSDKLLNNILLSDRDYNIIINLNLNERLNYASF